LTEFQGPVLQAFRPFKEAHVQKPIATENVNTVVVGAGQAGLSVGYHLQRHGVSFVILDANQRIGDQWRRRWDSLRLFTPARFCGLDGMRFPAPRNAFPTKDEMADYLESYARHFELPVRCSTRVTRLSRQGDHFLIVTSDGRFHALNVVIAMADHQRGRVPAYAGELRGDIVQLHSVDYRNPAQLQPGPVLIVGAGNSGAEIGVEVARHHETWLAGRDVGHVPFRIAGLPARLGLARLVLRGLFHRVLTMSTPIGRRIRPKLLHVGGPLIRQRPTELAGAGIRRAPRVAGVKDGLPLLDDGRTLEVSNVIWCTGFHPGFSWIDLPVFGPDGDPLHRSGIVDVEPGLYFVGLHFLHALSSEMIHGVGRDAARIATLVGARAPVEQASARSTAA
jgi:putative flavoprotein involved in K+ transport